MRASIGRKAGNDRVWIKARSAPTLLKAIERQKKEGETIPEVVTRLISLAISQSDRIERRKRFS
jgi:hypothetical protein